MDTLITCCVIFQHICVRASSPFLRVNENSTILWQEALLINTDVTLESDYFYSSV